MKGQTVWFILHNAMIITRACHNNKGRIMFGYFLYTRICIPL